MSRGCHEAGGFALSCLAIAMSQTVQAADMQVSTPPATNQAAETATLPELTIRAAPYNAYVAPDATTATKTDTPLMETPFSVQVITQQVLQDQKVTTLDQALVNVSGVRSSNIGWAEQIYLRGFSTMTYFRDGFRVDDPNGLGGLLTLANVDSVEVLKGPGSILYGRVEPGGVVNLITKQPQKTPHYSVEQSVGSWQHYITNLDATGPVNEDKTLLYRVIASHDQGNSWIDNVHDKRDFIAPTLQWNPNAVTQISLEASYSKNTSTLYQQSVVPYDTVNQQFLWGPRNANPAPYLFSPNTSFAGLKWSHAFNDDWVLRQQISRNQVDFSTPLNLSTAFGPLTQVGNTWTLGLGSAQLAGKTRSNGTVVDLTGHFATGAAKHTLLSGLDYYRTEATFNSRYSNPAGPFITVPLFSSVVSATSAVPLDPNTFYYTVNTIRATGIYVQDQIKLHNNLQFLAGLRNQEVTTSGANITGTNMGGTGLPVSTSTHDSAVTPRVGALWQPKDHLSLYASYTENFGATNGTITNFQGQPLKPEAAKQYEIGAKSETADGKLSATLALFDLTKTNMAAADFAHPGFQTSVGQVESKGAELTLQGQLAPGWDALAAYTYDKVVVKIGTAQYPQGSRMPFVPDQMLRLYSTYKLKGEKWAGWKVGGGMTWQGRAPGIYMDPVTFAMNTAAISSPAYEMFDAMASYEFKPGKFKYTFQLNVRNLFGKSYYTDAFMYVSPWGYVTYGAPRTLMASLKIEY